MSREEFLRKLEGLLSDVDVSERKEALQYYEEYFEDSEKAEEDVIKELGSPEEVAHSIREELAEKEIVLAGTSDFEGQPKQNAKQEKGEGTSSDGKKGMEPGIVVLIVLAAIFLGIPVGVPLITGAFGVILGLYGAIFGIVLAAAICFLAFGLSGIICLVASIVKLVTAPLAGIILLGTSFILFGLCFLCGLITWKICAVVIPATVRGLVYLCRLPFQGKKEGVA